MTPGSESSGLPGWLLEPRQKQGHRTPQTGSLDAHPPRAHVSGVLGTGTRADGRAEGRRRPGRRLQDDRRRGFRQTGQRRDERQGLGDPVSLPEPPCSRLKKVWHQTQAPRGCQFCFISKNTGRGPACPSPWRGIFLPSTQATTPLLSCPREGGGTAPPQSHCCLHRAVPRAVVMGGRVQSEQPSGSPRCLLVLSVTGESRKSPECGKRPAHSSTPPHWAMLGEPRGLCPLTRLSQMQSRGAVGQLPRH